MSEFSAVETLTIEMRKRFLRKLFLQIEHRQNEICRALYHDLRKSDFEAIATEITLVQAELRLFLRKLDRWSRPRRIVSGWNSGGLSGQLQAEPLGRVLIFSAWNYPFNLMMIPLIGAFAAGNCMVLKPSEYAPDTAALIADLVAEVFPPELVRTEQGGVETAQRLLKESFDYIFYTGGKNGGAAVARAAAEQLIPVTLELGGKSPCVLDRDADLSKSLRRIVWGKFLNAGQTCVAPDYLLVHRDLRPGLIAVIQEILRSFYGEDSSRSPDYSRIVNEHHFNRLNSMAEEIGLTFQGNRDNRWIPPIVVEEPPLDSRLMREEIFGPILPILYVDSMKEAATFIQMRPKPLALYYFGRENAEFIVQSTSSGSVCINDCVMQMANSAMPFGGIGASGTGAYHGWYSFDTFTHWKPVMKKLPFPELAMRYPPASDRKRKMLMFLGRFLR